MKNTIKKVTIMALAIISSISIAFAFSDLSSDHWAYEPIQKMTGKGIISGYSDGTFKP